MLKEKVECYCEGESR